MTRDYSLLTPDLGIQERFSRENYSFVKKIYIIETEFKDCRVL